MALLKAKQLNINDVTKAVLNSIASNYVYDLSFANLVNAVNSFSTGYGYPLPVMNITVNSVTNTTAVVRWNAVIAATSYDVQYYPQGSIMNVSTVLGVNALNCTLSGLLPNTIYIVEVKPNL